MLTRGILDNVFVEHHVVTGLLQAAETNIDFTLAWTANLMVLCLDQHAKLFEHQRHFTTHILKSVVRSNGEVTFLNPHAMTEIRFPITRSIPMCLVRIDFRVLN